MKRFDGDSNRGRSRLPPAVGSTKSDKDRNIEFRNRIVLDDLRVASTRVSELARYVGLGLATLIYVISSSDGALARAIVKDHRGWLIFLTVCGVFVILLDWAQYLISYWMANNASRRTSDVQKPLYVRGFLFRLRKVTFYVKQFVAVVGVVSFGILLGLIIFR